MKQQIIGRKPQIDELTQCLDSSKPELVAITGRRRVGKTYLIRQTYEGQIDFEITGLYQGNKAQQLQNFTITYNQYFQRSMDSVPKNWMQAFQILAKGLDLLQLEKKLILFFDELPWLSTKRSDFLTGFSWFWNSWASKKNVIVVICGSATSWMIDKVINDRGNLHNRVTRLIQLQPFTLYETELFLESKKVKLNRYQIIQLYMVMGGIPMYLEQVESGLSAVQNIDRICFGHDGYLRNEYERLLSSLFNKYENHEEIIRALSKKKLGLSRSEIIKDTSLTNGGLLTNVLKELDQSGFITIYAGYGKSKREKIYRLTDLYTLFYLQFLSLLNQSDEVQFTNLSELPAWRSWSGYAFENVCLNHITQIRKALSIEGIYSKTSTFYSKPKDGLSGTQIDLLIDRNDQNINICEIKFSTTDYALSKKDVDTIENKKNVFAYHSKSKKNLFVTLITNQSAIKNQHYINHIDQEVSGDDLFAS